MARVSLRRLIYKLQVACAVAADVCDHPIVYATLKQREALFRMGASREQVDKGFCSKAALDEFISDARAAVQAVRAVRMVFQPREIADGLLRELLLTWSPPGNDWDMLYEQEYTIRYAGDGISPWCDIPFKLMRELFDLFGISGARLHWMSRQQAENLYRDLRASPENAPEAVLARRQAAHLARCRELPEVKERIRVAQAEQTAAVVDLVT